MSVQERVCDHRSPEVGHPTPPGAGLECAARSSPRALDRITSRNSGSQLITPPIDVKPEQRPQVALLEDEHQHGVGRTDGEQVQDGRGLNAITIERNVTSSGRTVAVGAGRLMLWGRGRRPVIKCPWKVRT